MARWYANELGKLAQVSVRTLHHYDRIGLLKPSVRLDNNYRMYSEADLLKLQQIIALKFFGFELSQIRTLLAVKVGVIEQFKEQSQLLQKKAEALSAASKNLNSIISECIDDKSIPWETIIETIEVYRMTQQIENTWVSQVLNQEELKEYAGFEKELKTRFTSEEKKTSEQEWARLVSDISRNLDKDPKSEVGAKIAMRCMNWLNMTYGKKHASLRTSLWEKGFQQGKGVRELGMTPEIVDWLDKALDAYWRNRIYGVLAKVGKEDFNFVTQHWGQLLDEMYGDEQSQKAALVEAALKDDRVSAAAKKWLKSS